MKVVFFGFVCFFFLCAFGVNFVNAEPLVYEDGYYTNLFGGGTAAESHTGSFCNPDTGRCNGGGDKWVVKWVCKGSEETNCEAADIKSPWSQGTVNLTSSYTSTTGQNMSVECGDTVQIDVFSEECDADGGWTCGLPDDYMVWYRSCTVTQTPTPTATPESSTVTPTTTPESSTVTPTPTASVTTSPESNVEEDGSRRGGSSNDSNTESNVDSDPDPQVVETSAPEADVFNDDVVSTPVADADSSLEELPGAGLGDNGAWVFNFIFGLVFLVVGYIYLVFGSHKYGLDVYKLLDIRKIRNRMSVRVQN